MATLDPDRGRAGAVGGPIGGAIGAVAGQMIDQTILFAPKARHGPRLGDLAVQTSSYGSAIPKMFGTMRVAGTVIWATDLVEHARPAAAARGGPKTVNYSYSASFAVALSARPVLSVGRIWADGKLLRGAAGDFKSATGLPAAHGRRGPGGRPADRGGGGSGAGAGLSRHRLCGVRGFAARGFRQPDPLADLRGRGGCGRGRDRRRSPRRWAAARSRRARRRRWPAMRRAGDSVRGAIEALADVVPLSLARRWRDAAADARRRRGRCAIGADEECGEREIVRRGAGQVPGEVSIAYYELERDYQAGLQRAVARRAARGRPTGARCRRRFRPAAAKALAEHRLGVALGRAGDRQGCARLARAPALRPGDRVTLGGRGRAPGG